MLPNFHHFLYNHPLPCGSQLLTTSCILSALGLCCFAWAFSTCGQQGLLSSRGAWASHCNGFSCCGAQALGTQASEVTVYGLSCSIAHGIFQDQGSNSHPLNWQADFLFFFTTGPSGRSLTDNFIGPGSSNGKKICLQCRKPGFNPWVRNIPWRRGKPTPVFLPGKTHRQRNLAGYSPWGHKESDVTE